MVWATVSSWSCFCWLYRASLSLAAKNIINLILVLAIWWCPYTESSLVLLEESVCYDQCKSLLAFPCFILYSKENPHKWHQIVEKLPQRTFLSFHSLVNKEWKWPWMRFALSECPRELKFYNKWMRSSNFKWIMEIINLIPWIVINRIYITYITNLLNY